MPELFRIVALKANPDDYTVEIIWMNGDTGKVDMSPSIKVGGVFRPLIDPEVFKGVEITPEGGGIVWPNCKYAPDVCAADLWTETHPEVELYPGANHTPAWQFHRNKFAGPKS